MERGKASMESTYKNDFKDMKNVKGMKIDYKELNSFQDKFK